MTRPSLSGELVSFRDAASNARGAVCPKAVYEAKTIRLLPTMCRIICCLLSAQWGRPFTCKLHLQRWKSDRGGKPPLCLTILPLKGLELPEVSPVLAILLKMKK